MRSRRMTHRPFAAIRLIAVAAAACALVAAAAPASANQTQRPVMTQKSTRAPLLQHAGPVNTSATHYFTVFLNKASAASATTVANYFRQYGLTARVMSNNKSVQVVGTFGQAAAA